MAVLAQGIEGDKAHSLTFINSSSKLIKTSMVKAEILLWFRRMSANALGDSGRASHNDECSFRTATHDAPC